MSAAEGTLVELPIGSVRPDPTQPRQAPDAELADSLKSVGQLLPIRVEAAESGYMIQDGERRWRGLRELGATRVLAIVVPPATEGQRLLRQLVANSGQPLTPLEEARAYRRLMELEGWSINRVAQELGKPRSTVGDRVRALELDAVWIEMIAAGELQLSHAPILHRYAAVPHDYQLEAAESLREHWQWKQARKHGEPIAVDELDAVVDDCYDGLLQPLEDVPGYDGPIVEVAPYEGEPKQKYAADPALWRPILESAPKKKSRSTGSSSSYTPSASWEKGLPAGVQKRKTTDGYPQPIEGEAMALGSSGWPFYGRGAQPFDPRVLLERAAPESLVKVTGKYSVCLMTTDLDAMEAARAAFDTRVAAVYEERTAAVRAALERARDTSPVHGSGCLGLAAWALRTAGGRSDVDPFDLIQILGLADVSASDRDVLWDVADEDQEDDVVPRVVADMQARGTLTTFCSLLAAIPTLDVEVPSSEEVRREIIEEYERVDPRWAGAASGKKKAKKERRAKNTAAAADVMPPVDTDEREGDPISLVKKRARSYGNRKIIDEGFAGGAVEAAL